jgi:WD40 repeat protein
MKLSNKFKLTLFIIIVVFFVLLFYVWGQMDKFPTIFPHCIAISPDNRYVITGPSLRLWGIDKNEIIRLTPTGLSEGLNQNFKFSDDSNYLAYQAYGKNDLFDMSTKKIIYSVDAVDGCIIKNRYLLTAQRAAENKDYSEFVFTEYDIITKEKKYLSRLSVPRGGSAITIHPVTINGENYLTVVYGIQNMVQILSYPDMKLFKAFKSVETKAIAGNYIFTGNTRINIENGFTEELLDDQGKIDLNSYWYDISKDGAYLVYYIASGKIKVWDINNKRTVNIIKDPDQIGKFKRLAISSDKTLVAIGIEPFNNYGKFTLTPQKGEILVYNINTGQLVKRYKSPYCFWKRAFE